MREPSGELLKPYAKPFEFFVRSVLLRPSRSIRKGFELPPINAVKPSFVGSFGQKNNPEL